MSFYVVRLDLTGISAADWLREHHGMRFELSDHCRLMALVGFAHTDAAIDRLIAALTALVDAHGTPTTGTCPTCRTPRTSAWRR